MDFHTRVQLNLNFFITMIKYSNLDFVISFSFWFFSVLIFFFFPLLD